MIFVTSNRHKFEEISDILERRGISVRWEEIEYEEIQSDTIENISYDSCYKLAKKINEDFFLEDTGIQIESLKDFPGPYSSYVQRTIGNSGILKLVNDDRRAYFKTVVSLYYKESIFQFTGVLKGTIASGEKGDKGFGYDPIFIPEGSNKTLSEMSLEDKNRISHRGKAIQRMVDYVISKESS